MASRVLTTLMLFLGAWADNGEDAGPFLRPERTASPFVEVFKDFKSEYEYHFHRQAATWKQARIICESNNASLAELKVKDAAMFVSGALAESVIVNQNLWIGGRKVDSKFLWVSSEEDMGQHFWAEVPPSKSGEDVMANRSCVAFERKKHDIPLFIKLDCELSRPFICQAAATKNQHIEEVKPSITIGHHTYHLYHGEVTWKEALAYCTLNNMTLASITAQDSEAEGITKLARRMLRTRPVIENAWIGASYDRERTGWFWQRKDVNEAIQTSADMHTQYPPWFAGLVTAESGCVLLDRHVCDEPAFLPAHCERKRSFICEQLEQRVDDWTNPAPGFFFSTFRMSWPEAMAMCRHVSPGASLVDFEDDVHLKVLVDLMAINDFEVSHIWVRGKIIFPERKIWWMNTATEKEREFETSEFTNVLCDEDKDFNPNMACLNLDRENHNQPMVYGLNCNIRQHFACSSSQPDALVAFKGLVSSKRGHAANRVVQHEPDAAVNVETNNKEEESENDS